ncbi:MAG TPA: nicotinate-nucleotide adenylyltransferase [Vicinamibacterales bacterium]
MGVLGGTFDPVHNGHLAAGDAAQKALQLDAMTLIPSHIPPHRHDPVRATSEQRYEMAVLAAAGRPGWSASRIEVDRNGRSYTYDTLVELRQTVHGDWQFFFILGADAFAEIATWSRYPAVLDLAHFVVVSRPGITLDSLRERVPSAFDRSSSAPTRVILLESLTPDISSTDIRRRVRAGEPLDGFVPDPVAAYIRQHRLYSGR